MNCPKVIGKVKKILQFNVCIFCFQMITAHQFSMLYASALFSGRNYALWPQLYKDLSSRYHYTVTEKNHYMDSFFGEKL